MARSAAPLTAAPVRDRGNAAAMGRRRDRKRTRVSRGDRWSLVLEMFDLIAGVAHLLARIPVALLRLFT